MNDMRCFSYIPFAIPRRLEKEPRPLERISPEFCRLETRTAEADLLLRWDLLEIRKSTLACQQSCYETVHGYARADGSAVAATAMCVKLQPLIGISGIEDLV